MTKTTIVGFVGAALAVSLATVAVPAEAAVPPPPFQPRLVYSGEISSGQVLDSSGSNNPGSIGTSFGGSVTQVTDAGTGQAYLRFPAATCLSAQAGHSCPQATISPTVQSALNPSGGNGDMIFGATVRLSTTAGTAGMNIFQRGYYTAGRAQWKLQIDYRANLGYRVASCRFADTANSVLLFGTKPLATGTWYKLSCERSGNTFSVAVVQVGGSDANETVTMTRSLGAITPTRDAIIGAKSVSTDPGRTDATIDQFHGDLDDVFFGSP